MAVPAEEVAAVAGVDLQHIDSCGGEWNVSGFFNLFTERNDAAVSLFKQLSSSTQQAYTRRRKD